MKFANAGNDVGSTTLTAAEIALKLAREYALERRVASNRIAIVVNVGPGPS